jgi:hypothetical protein
MISPADFIRLPYTPDLTTAGAAYACRSLAHTYDRMGGGEFKRLRRIAAGIAVELAFRRHLGAGGVPFDTLGATPFTDPDKYDIALGGRKCDVKSYLIYHKGRIREMSADPARLLNAEALVPVDQVNSDHLPDDGLYVFGFLAALVTDTQADLARAVAAEQPILMIHPMPGKWAHPPHWQTLGELAAKTDAPAGMRLEIGGQDSAHKFASLPVALPPGTRVSAGAGWHAVSYLASRELPAGTVGIHSPTLGETHLAQAGEWGNIWLYGMEMILTGYIKRGEFRRRARRLPAGARVFQYPQTRTENFCLPMKELYPLPALFTRARNWAEKHNRR